MLQHTARACPMPLALPSLPSRRRGLDRRRTGGRRDGGKRCSPRRHARRSGGIGLVAGGLSVMSAAEDKREYDDDEDGAGNPSPGGGSTHPCIHIHLPVHSPVKIAGVCHGTISHTVRAWITRTMVTGFLCISMRGPTARACY